MEKTATVHSVVGIEYKSSAVEVATEMINNPTATNTCRPHTRCSFRSKFFLVSNAAVVIN